MNITRNCSYDKFNRLSTYYDGKKETPTDSEKIRYEYNDKDQVVKIDYPEAAKNIKSVLYEYDNRARVSRIKVITSSDATAKTVREYTYSPKGNIATMKDFTGFDTGSGKYILRTYEYDKFDRVIKMSYANNGNLNTPVEEYNYTYDKNGNILTEDIYNNYIKSKPINELKEYTYDNLGRLTNVKVTDRANENKVTTKSYTYDKVGNRLTETDSSGTKTYSYNNLNELLNIKKDDTILTRYFYDKNGNEIKEVSGTTVINKQYDINNQMITYDKYEDGKNTFFVDSEYNYNGQRKEKTVSTPYQDTGTLVGNPVYYYYSNGSLLYTTNTSNKMLSSNILNLEGNVISSARDTDFYAYNKDIRNSTSSIVNQYNNGVVTYKYDEFGNTEVLVNKEFDNEICYTGGIYDKETGEYYLNARHYDPTTARFTSVDTYRGETEEPLSLHLYTYCANNPINFVDPSGHSYSANAAIKYAQNHFNDGQGIKPYNKYYYNFAGSDCANFVSQCLKAGGFKENNTWHGSKSYCNGSKWSAVTDTWMNCKSQHKWIKKYCKEGRGRIFNWKGGKNFGKRLKKVLTKRKVGIGSVIYFSIGRGSKDHAALINRIASNKKNLYYTAHTVPSFDKSLYDHMGGYKRIYIMRVNRSN